MIFNFFWHDHDLTNAIVFHDHQIPPLMNYCSDHFKFAYHSTLINFCNFMLFLDLFIIDWHYFIRMKRYQYDQFTLFKSLSLTNL